LAERFGEFIAPYHKPVAILPGRAGPLNRDQLLPHLAACLNQSPYVDGRSGLLLLSPFRLSGQHPQLRFAAPVETDWKSDVERFSQHGASGWRRIRFSGGHVCDKIGH
jgi:hypothetical protein